MSKLNIAFVGCGRIADLHAAAYAGHPEARLYAICDRDPATLARRAAEWGVERTYDRFEELLADPQVDAVEILTPQLLHEPMVIAAARAGKHVAVQKPISVDLASTDRMVAAARAAGIVFKVTENYVFYPPIVKARQLIEQGAIGEPVAVRIQYVSGPEGGWEVPAAAWEWRLEEARAGRGPTTFDHGHHLWSTAWYLLGPAERVCGWIDPADGIIDSPALFMWKYAGGRRYGTCSFVHGERLRVPSRYYSNDEWLEVYGSRGILFVRRCTGNIHDGPALTLFDGEGFRPFSEDEVRSDWQEGFTGAARNFVDAIAGRAAPLLDGAQAREVLRFSLALQRAARLRREVWVEELDRRWPGLYAWRRRRQERAAAAALAGSGRRGLLERLGWGQRARELAPRARALTEELVAGFTPPTPPVPDASIGLVLRGDDLPEQRFGLVVQGNQARLLDGELPADARLTVTMRPSTWAAILLKKKRIELAVLQGQVSFSGEVQEALKLKDAFRF